jgi:hypothetical protein
MIMPPVTKLLLLGMLLSFTVATVRAGRLYWRLRRGSGGTVTNEELRGIMPDPHVLATLAMAGRIPEDVPEEGLSATSPLAKARFLYLWDGCNTDVRSIGRSTLSIALLTFIAVAHSAHRLYFYCSEDTTYSGSYCLMETTWWLMDVASLGLAICMVLHLTTSHFERTLAVRKTRWNYFCERMAQTLPR